MSNVITAEDIGNSDTSTWGKVTPRESQESRIWILEGEWKMPDAKRIMNQASETWNLARHLAQRQPSTN